MTFKDDLTELLNVYSKEEKSGTPDYILSKFLRDSLKAFEHAVNDRDNHYMEASPISRCVYDVDDYGLETCTVLFNSVKERK